MNRRDLITTGVGLGAAVLASSALGSRDARADDKKPAAGDPRLAVLDALSACIARSELCAAHCQVELASGAREFARCAAAVQDMLAIAATAQNLIARKSPQAKRIAELCATACKECSAACGEHKAHWAHNMHLECKACMESCDACLKACTAFAAAA
ncbi:MAG TPA: hypothetical protein VFP84_12825 [Kofleriaceae bacterium]|nr:hypothetical protein [Kofleriaceae bacterium]